MNAENNRDQSKPKAWFKNKRREMSFLLAVAGMSTVFGFGFTVALAKKKDPNMFSKVLLDHTATLESIILSCLLVLYSTGYIMDYKEIRKFKIITYTDVIFNRGMLGHRGIPESGGSLALKALGWGTLYSVGGFGLFCFSVCKLMSVHNMEEFRYKMQNIMPALSKKEQQGKNDFKTVKELVDYIIHDGSKKS